jgi:hypothetical protein
MAYAYNAVYLGGKNQKDQGSRSALGK